MKIVEVIHNKNNIKCSSFIPLILFIFAFLMRIALISKGPYHPDTIRFIEKAQRTIETGQLQPYLTGYNLPVLLGALSISIQKVIGLNDPIQAINFVSVLFGSLLIPVFYSFCRKMWDEQTAFFGSALLSVFPLFLSLSTFGTSQIPALFFLFLGLASLADIQKNRRRAWWLAAISFGLAGASRPQDLCFMFLPISYLYLFLASREDSNFAFIFRKQQILDLSKFWLCAALIIILVPLPFLFHEGHPPQFETFKNLYTSYLAPDSTDIKHLFLMFGFSTTVLVEELTWAILLLSAYGFFLLWKRSPQLFGFLFLSAVVPFVAYICLLHKIMPTSRYFLIALPPFFIASGYAVRCLIQNTNKIFRITCLVLFFLLLCAFLFRILPTLIYRHYYSTSVDLAQWVDRITEPNAVIIVSDETDFVREYGHRQVLYWPTLNKQDFDQKLNELLQKSPVYVFIPIRDGRIFSHYYSLFVDLRTRYHLRFMGKHSFEFWVHSTTTLQIFPDLLFKIEP